MFKQSDKVVYIGDPRPDAIWMEDHPGVYQLFGFGPQKGPVYDVAKVLSDGDGLVLTGSSVIHVASGDEVGWKSRCFRKVSDIQAENELARTLVASNGESL